MATRRKRLLAPRKWSLANVWANEGAVARCPSCGERYGPEELRVREGSTRGLAICKPCHLLGGPDGHLRRR